MVHGDIEASPHVDVDDVLALIDEVLKKVFQGQRRLRESVLVAAQAQTPDSV